MSRNVKLFFAPRSITSLPRRQLMNLHNNEAGRRAGFENRHHECDHAKLYFWVMEIVFLCHGDYFAMWFGGRSLV